MSIEQAALHASLEGIGREIVEEAFRAASKHPPMHSRHEAKAVIEEEFDEFWELVKLNPKKALIHPTKGYPMSVERWKAEMREELIQMAAMCMRAIQDVA